MNRAIDNILLKEEFSKEDIIALLETEGEEEAILFRKAAEIREKYIGNKVWFRGLIEFSNICSKNCLYCGIRRENKNITRYNLSDEEILAAAKFAFENHYGSIALQSGEVESEAFTERITRLLKNIGKMSGGRLGITLSVGEQKPEVYKKWFDAGAHRYLLRIEASERELYEKIHPDDGKHNFDRRLACLGSLKEIGYQTGTGVMIGLPFQTVDDLASDLLFMKEFDIDMCGMGPYIEHPDTPFMKYSGLLFPPGERLDLTLKMIAVLRIMMKDINIVAATALQAIEPSGREKAIKIGANILMPNITPAKYRGSYKLYENKPLTEEDSLECQNALKTGSTFAGMEVIHDEWGDSKHYFNRINKAN
ncbi:MAG: [FeFe] hydrogenase H-cluster radical SAM maturase HydE [Bacteroidales bacterium]|nr:[FeFe] hydrogenase H-cluster radical SAM maturase HydE [Bacteroidales bacterium]